MTASRIEPQKVSALASVRVQANWKGVDLTEANGGLFSAPVQFQGNLALLKWLLRFPTLTGTGTSGALKLTFPELNHYPDQYGVSVVNQGVLGQGMYQAGVITVTMVLVQNTQIAVTGMLASQLANY